MSSTVLAVWSLVVRRLRQGAKAAASEVKSSVQHSGSRIHFFQRMMPRRFYNFSESPSPSGETHDGVRLTASEGNRKLSLMTAGKACVSEQVALFAEVLPTYQKQKKPVRRLPVGSEPQLGGGVDFRVWAPQCREVAVEFEGASAEAASMQPEPDGYFSLMVPTAGAGMRYRFRLDRGETSLADPASPISPTDHTALPRSLTLTPFVGRMSDGAACPASTFSTHVRTARRHFHRGGRGRLRPASWHRSPVLASRASKSCRLRKFAGRFGWGYDGVNLFARQGFMVGQMISAALSIESTFVRHRRNY